MWIDRFYIKWVFLMLIYNVIFYSILIYLDLNKKKEVLAKFLPIVFPILISFNLSIVIQVTLIQAHGVLFWYFMIFFLFRELCFFLSVSGSFYQIRLTSCLEMDLYSALSDEYFWAFSLLLGESSFPSTFVPPITEMDLFCSVWWSFSTICILKFFI